LTFLGTCFLGIIFALLSPEEGLWAWVLPHGLFESIHVLLVFFSLFLAYVITYSALKVDSPSLVIIKIIAEAMPMGLTRQDLENRLTDDILILPRIKDLLRDNLVVANGERLQLTPQGRTLIKIVVSYRSLLKLGKGG